MKRTEGTAMKSKAEMTKRAVYLGAAAGLFVFALAGLLPSSFIGGVLGLQVAQHLMGSAGVLSIVPRAVVGFSMLLGVTVTGVVFVGSASVLGWLCGQIGFVAKSRLSHRLA
jgi:hypothetical protein